MVKFKLSIAEIRNYKARITERLIQRYIDSELSENLKKDGFELTFFNEPFLPWGTPQMLIMAGMNPDEIDWEQHFLETHAHHRMGNRIIIDNGKWLGNENDKKKYIEYYKEDMKNSSDGYLKNILIEFYVNRNIFPSKDLIWDTIYLHSILTVATDGLLFRLKNTGKTFDKKKLVDFKISEETYANLPNDIPIYSGKIDVIEVKSDTGSIASNQVKAYSMLLEAGFKLRYFHVFVNSIIDNDFDIDEIVLENPAEIEPLIKQYRKKSKNHVNSLKKVR